MVLKQILLWWYGPGWVNAFKAITKRVELFADALSIQILLNTLFEPWKQIKSYGGPNAALDAKIRVLFDNIFARIFGFFIRFCIIVIGSILLVFIAIFGLILAIIWPVLPALPVFCIVLAVISA
jgi:hypothetical protein